MSLRIFSIIWQRNHLKIFRIDAPTKEHVAKKRRELEMIENIIDVKIKMTEEALHLNFKDITIEYFPEDTLYLSKNIENSTEEQFVKAVSDFIEELDRSQLDTGYPIGGITRREQVLAGNYDNYSYLYIGDLIQEKGILILRR